MPPMNFSAHRFSLRPCLSNALICSLRVLKTFILISRSFILFFSNIPDLLEYCFFLMSPVYLLILVFNQLKHIYGLQPTILLSRVLGHLALLLVSPADICSCGGSPMGCGIWGGELMFREVCLWESRAVWPEGISLLHIHRSICFSHRFKGYHQPETDSYVNFLALGVP